MEFLESLSELKEWGNEAKEKEVVFDWSEYHPKSHPYEKVRSTFQCYISP